MVEIAKSTTSWIEASNWRVLSLDNMGLIQNFGICMYDGKKKYPPVCELELSVMEKDD